MLLEQLRIAPHPAGNRIDISWLARPVSVATGLRVVRRERGHPRSPEDGVIVAEVALPANAGENSVPQQVSDTGLTAETVYYYTLFPFEGHGNAGRYLLDQTRQLTATATGPYGFGESMYQLLPPLYARYDEREQSQLRSFLQLVGDQLDEFYSSIRSMRDLHDIEHVDGRLLALPAQTIDWPINQRLALDEQRIELRHAPFIYQRMGIIATVEATIKRLIGWESRVKEFVENVVRSNQPEQLLLWSRRVPDRGRSEAPHAPLSVDGAYEGRPAVLRDSTGQWWLVFQVVRGAQGRLWYKTATDGLTWTPSRKIEGEQVERRPVLVEHGSGLWLFCEAVDQQAARSRIVARRWNGNAWVTQMIPGFEQPEQRYPQALADAAGRLWLFWIEPVGPIQRLCYRWYQDGTWSDRVSVPEDGQSAWPIRDLFALADPNGAIRLFWARRERVEADGRRHWRIAWRIKAGSEPTNQDDWSPVATLDPPGTAAAADEYEPAAVLRNTTIELYWSSNRGGSRSIWRATLAVTPGAVPEAIEMITPNPFTERAPFAVRETDATLLFYRSNESLRYTSPTYSATETVDNRYAGGTSVDVHNQSKLALRGQFNDFQTHTYDTGRAGIRDESNLYARDTIGIYLTPDTEDPTRILGNRKLVEGALRGFLPIQVRTVFIIEAPAYRELVYTYDDPEAQPARKIGEESSYSLETLHADQFSGLRDGTAATMPTWIWLRSWDPEILPSDVHLTADTSDGVRNLKYRTWYGLLDEGEQDD
jgi:hypothetical protein